MNKLSLIFLTTVLSSSLLAQNTVLRTLDSLLLDANYAEIIKITNNKITTDAFASLQLDCKRVQALIRSGNIEEARSLIKSLEKEVDSITTNKEFAIAILNANKGSLYLNEGRNDLALETLQAAIKSFERSGKSNSLEAADAIATLGMVYNVTGKSQQAKEQLLKSLSLRKKQLDENHELIAASYNDLGLVHTEIDPDKALDYYGQALKVYQKLHGFNHPKIAIVNTNLGFIYRELELYGDAVHSLETALTIWETIYKEDHPSKAFVLSNLGQTHLKIGDTKAAEEYLNNALKMYQGSYSKKHPDIASTLNLIGKIKLSQKSYDEAINYYQKALQANVRNFNNDDVTANPSIEGFYNGNVLLYSLMYKAQAFEAKYLGKTLKFSDLLLSMETIKKCDALAESLRNRISNESDKLALGVIASELYGDGVRIAYTLWQNAWEKKLYKETAFYFAEKSKSAVLQEAISHTHAKSFAGIPETLLEEEKHLKALKAYCNQQLAQKPSAEKEQLLRDVLYKANRDYEAFVKSLEEKFPEYYNLKFNSAAPSISDIQKELNEDTAIISYFLDETNLTLYTFVITASKFQMDDNAIPSDFDRQITGLRNSLFYNNMEVFKKSAEVLSNVLITRIPRGITHLVIIPTGRIGVIPFETLLTKSVKKINNYSAFPYLLKKYNINYEFSAGLILQKAKTKRPLSTNPSILLCAPVEFTGNKNLDLLPGTEKEVNEIAQLFTSQNLKNKILIRDDAHEDQIKSPSIKDYKYLHFATHGIVDEDDPELSRIFLNPRQNEDGNLYSGEIYNLQLDADLVVLSACETGLGKISKGEGVIGLSRALVYAGARSIVVSFWEVLDASTSLLMADFYSNLLSKNEQDFSSALRTSKLKMIEGDTYSAPYYWAPFVILGF